jgi:hypothetical protein
VIFVLAGAKPVSMRYDPALMSIGCPSMRWFLGHFLCRLVPVRRLAADVYTVAFGSVLVGLRQWNHHWFDTVLGGLPWTSSSCVDPVDRWSELQWLELVRTYIELRSIRTCFISPMVSRSITSGYAHIVYTHKGKRVTSEYWIVSRVSVRWSSTSTIRTLMAWRSNIPQKSFLFWEIVHPFFRMICILHANGNLYNWPSPVVHFLLCFCAIKNA